MNYEPNSYYTEDHEEAQRTTEKYEMNHEPSLGSAREPWIYELS